MPKRKKRSTSTALRKKKDDSQDDMSEGESHVKPPLSKKKVEAASSTSQLEDEMDHISSFTSMSSRKVDSSDRAALMSHFLCNYCEFSADTKKVLVAHMRQHMIKCPDCSFSSLSRVEITRHCRYEHDKSYEVAQEVDSSGTDCDMDKDPCSACIFCNFSTYSTEHLEKHTILKHPGMLARSVAKMITKQASKEVRKADALFYLAFSDDESGQPSVGDTYSPGIVQKSSVVIEIDTAMEKVEDFKPKFNYPVDATVDSVKSKLACDVSSGNLLISKKEIGTEEIVRKVETSSTVSQPVKVEAMYCLTCSYSNVYIEKVKCHTVVQHPVGAAAATYSTTGESINAQDIIFFCVKEDCNQSSGDCSVYQKHLMDCCLPSTSLKVSERERLRSTITYILEFHSKHSLQAEDGFYDFASPYLEFSLPFKLPPKLTRSQSTECQSFSTKTCADAPVKSLSPETNVGHVIPSFQLIPAAPLPSSVPQSLSSQPLDSNYSRFSHQTQCITPQQTQCMTSQQTPCMTPQQTQCITPQQIPCLTPQQTQCITTQQPQCISLQQQQSIIPQQSQCIAPQQQQGYPQQPPYIISQQPQGVPLQQSQFVAAVSSGYCQEQVPVGSTAMATPMNIGSVTRPPEGIMPQPSHNMSNQLPAAYFQQNQICSQSLVTTPNTSYQDMPQMNVSWPHSQPTATTSQVSVPIQPEQNFNPAFQNQHLPGNGEHVGSTTVCNQLQPGTLNSFHLNQTTPVEPSFSGPPHRTYTPPSKCISLDSQSSLNTSTNSCQNLATNSIQTPVSVTSNAVTSQVFYQQPQPVSSILNIPDVQTGIETQSQPRMLDLLSESYSILLSNDCNGGGQVQDNSINSQPQMTPTLSTYQHDLAATTQCQTMVPQTPSTTPSQDHSTTCQSVQGTTVVHLVTNNPLPQRSDVQFSNLPTTEEVQMTSVTNLSSSSSFQASHNSSNFGSPCTALPSHEVGIQAKQVPSVPNFLVSTSESILVQSPQQHSSASSFLNPQAAAPSIVHSQPSTPPRNVTSVGKAAGTSPLSPSIYLSGQVPRHRRSNWTATDMRPRGLALAGVPPRNTISQPAPGLHAHQRLFVTGRGGYPRASRMPSVRGRMPAPRMARGSVDDDEVIVTAVIGPRPQQHDQRSLQQSGGRFVGGRGGPAPAPRGRGQASGFHSRHVGQASGARGARPAAALPVPAQPQKQFDISKHFEDLACVVNASADEGNDDIEILGVTPGNDKGNQPKAVDASHFSFCCVHCGKDQGSKNVMKQHMKARHNDSLLGAFTNIDTGQLLFFCPQLTCEFMTYDEKRLSEHLEKCYDLDKSKPYDFGTAIKNLKSLKIRQMVVGKMGRSHDNPIDLDGQGMKDNFSSSLNDAFQDIVVNTSGRQGFRFSTPPRRTQPHVQPHALSPQNAASQGRVPFRNQSQGSPSTRPSYPGLSEHSHISNRMVQQANVRHPRMQNPEMRSNLRQIFRPPIPIGIRGRSIQEMQPRIPANMGHHPGLRPGQTAAPPSKQSRLPGVGSQDPIVIILDADSPERPEEMEQNVNERPSHGSEQRISVTSNPISNSEDMAERNTRNARFAQEEYSLSVTQSAASGHQHSFRPRSLAFTDKNSTLANRTVSAYLPTNMSPNQWVTETTGGVAESRSNEFYMQQDNERIHTSVQCSDSTFQNSVVENTNNISETASDASVNNAVSSTSLPLENVITHSTDNTPDVFSAGQSFQVNQRSIDDLHNNPCSSNLATPVNTHTTSFTLDCLSEEEKVNAAVLDKVFARVPNMPKNLSRRLVAKFKEYAEHRGVKITPDSKVIDEFVSKIYYKGSTAEKNVTRVQTVARSPASVRESMSPVVSEAVHSQPSPVPEPSESTTEEPLYDPEYLNVSQNLQSITTSFQEVPALENSEETLNEAEVLTTGVVYAERILQFSDTFASMASKALAASAQTADVKLRNPMPATDLVQEQKSPSSSVHENVFKKREAKTRIQRRNSVNGNCALSKVANPLQRSGSLPLQETLITSETMKSSGWCLNENMDISSVHTTIASPPHISPSRELLPASPLSHLEVCAPLVENLTQEKLPTAGSDQKNEASAPPLPTLLSSHVKHTVAILNVDYVPSANPGLEYKVVGSSKDVPNVVHPVNKDFEGTDTMVNTKEVKGQSGSLAITKKAAVKRSSFIDKVTGKLLLKKTKRGRPKKMSDETDKVPDEKDKAVSNEEENPTENLEKQTESLEATLEEHFVRRSSRSRKPVQKDYQSEANEIDELMSDDDEEYNIEEEDDDSDTDNEWEGNTEQSLKKKIKKVESPPDPTAFDTSTKGKFKCWLCRKIFSRCFSTKPHILQKHPQAGLCTIYLDRSEETKKPCLLLFCPRICKYTTESLEELRNHIQGCSKPPPAEEKFLEIHSQFLASKYIELQNMELEALLNPTKAKKPKDPEKALKAKKRNLGITKQSIPVTAVHGESYPQGGAGSSIISPTTPLHGHVISTYADKPAVHSVTHQASPFVSTSKHDHRYGHMHHAVPHEKSAILNVETFSQRPQHSTLGSLLSGPHSATHSPPQDYSHCAQSASRVHAPALQPRPGSVSQSHPSANLFKQRILTSPDQSQPSSLFPHHPLAPSQSIYSTDQEYDVMYVD